MKNSSVEKKIKNLEEAISRLEKGMYPSYSVEYITDQIAWMSKWKVTDKKKIDELAQRMIDYFERMR